LYFSEREKPGDFYITVDGAQPTLFSATNPPSIVTTQGSVEEWTIENRTREIHAFHIHQIHFKLLEQDGIPAPPIDAQFRDTVNIPPWPGTGPYPRVTLRMDFRGIDVGDFVYHCHILAHEDMGMMAIIRVLPRS
jgi:FtsP/CotA-like multicopper oxidase with cupredoxin domain